MSEDWDGEWWAEQLEGKEKEKYDEIVARLQDAKISKLPDIARELFEMGHKHGFELASNLSCEG